MITHSEARKIATALYNRDTPLDIKARMSILDLAQQVEDLTAELALKNSFIESAFNAHPNLDLDIAGVK